MAILQRHVVVGNESEFSFNFFYFFFLTNKNSFNQHYQLLYYIMLKLLLMMSWWCTMGCHHFKLISSSSDLEAAYPPNGLNWRWVYVLASAVWHMLCVYLCACSVNCLLWTKPPVHMHYYYDEFLLANWFTRQHSFHFCVVFCVCHMVLSLHDVVRFSI